MKWDVIIVVRCQRYAVFLVKQERRQRRFSATGKSLRDNAEHCSETVRLAQCLDHDAPNVPSRRSRSNKMYRLLVIRLEQNKATHDTAEVVVNLAKTCHVVEVETCDIGQVPMGDEFFQLFGIKEENGTSTEIGSAAGPLLFRNVFYQEPNIRNFDTKVISRPAAYVSKTRYIRDHTDTVLMSTILYLIREQFRINHISHIFFDSESSLTGCLHSSRGLPCLQSSSSEKISSTGDCPKQTMKNAGFCARHCIEGYHRIRCVLATAIFKCLSSENPHLNLKGRSIEAVDILVEQLLQAMLSAYLFRKWSSMPLWKRLWLKLEVRQKFIAATYCEKCGCLCASYKQPHLVKSLHPCTPIRHYNGTCSKATEPICRFGESTIFNRRMDPLTKLNEIPSACFLLTIMAHTPCTSGSILTVDGRSKDEKPDVMSPVRRSGNVFEENFNSKECNGSSVGKRPCITRSLQKHSKPCIAEVIPNQYWSEDCCLSGFTRNACSAGPNVALPDATNQLSSFRLWSVKARCNVALPTSFSDQCRFSTVDVDGPNYCNSLERFSQNQGERQQVEMDEVAIGIIAASCRLPGGVSDYSELWDLLKTGRNTASRIPASRIASRDTLIEGKVYGVAVEGGNFITQDVSEFDPSFFNISISEAENMDPQHRILLECVQECVENAGLTDTSNVGVFIGLMGTEYPEMMKTNGSISSMLGSMYAVVSGRISYILGSHGPSMTVDTACSSSLVAADLAISALKSGRCSTAIVAGVNLILSEKGQGVRANGNMLSRHGISLSFDASASGYGRSDGCVVLMLERMKPGKMYMSEVIGMNVNHGGRSTSLTTPNPHSQQMLINTLLRNCKCDDLQYWEAHGTGTRVGDVLEINALSSTFQNVTVGSIKASIGHGEAAAGATALLKLALMLRNNYIPPLVNFHVTNSKMDMGSLVLPAVGEERTLVNCGVTSFGVSGTNAAAMVRRSRGTSPIMNALRKHYFVPISAKNMESLNTMLREVKNFLPNSNENMEDIAAAFAFHKNHYSHRCALIVDRRGRETQKSFGTCHKKMKTVALILSDADVSYDMLHVPGFAKHFDSLHCERSLPDEDKLVICFIRLAAETYGPTELFAQTGRELILALMAFSFLTINPVSVDLLQMGSLPELVEELEKLGITSLNNVILERYINSTHPCVQDSSVFKIHCDKSSIMTRFNFLVIFSHLYIDGIDLDFSCLYTKPLRYVHIPTYSFNRRTIWFMEKPPVFDHYLLGMVKRETEVSVIFRNWLDNLRHPHLFTCSSVANGAIIEIAHAALTKETCDSEYIMDIKVAPLNVVFPCLLETEVKRINGWRVVSAHVNKRHFFTCIAPALDGDQMQNVIAKLNRLPTTGEAVADMQPLVIPELQSRILVTEDLRYAFVSTEHNESPYFTAIEVSMNMNPVLELGSVHCISPLPLEFEVQSIRSRERALVVVRSQYKTLMCVYLCAPQCRGSTSYLEKVMLPVNNSTDLLKRSTSAEDGFKEFVNAASCNFQGYNRHISDLLHYAVGQRTAIKNHIKDRASLEMKNKVNHPWGNDVDEVLPSTRGNVTKKVVSTSEATRSQRHNNKEDYRTSTLTDARNNELIFPHRVLEASRSLGGLQACSSASLLSRGNKAKKTRGRSTGDFESHPSEKRTKFRETHNNHNRQNLLKCRADRILEAVLNATQDVLSQQIPISEETLSMGFVDLGLDSLNLVEFVSRLNQKYFPGMNISTADIFDYPTIMQLADHIREAKAHDFMENHLTEKSPNCKLDKIQESVLHATQEVLSQQIPISKETLSMGFVDLGLDSLNLVEFVSRLNQKYFPGMNISTADIFDYPTIMQLAEHIREKKAHDLIENHVREKLPDRKLDGILGSVLNAIQDVLSQQISTSDEILCMGFAELGLDSLNMVEFVSRLNQKYFLGMDISAADIFDYPTIMQLAAYIEEKKRQSTAERHSSSPLDSSPANSKNTWGIANEEQCSMARDRSQECSAYAEVFEDADEQADILLTSWNVDVLSVVNLHDGSNLQFTSESLPAPDFSRIIANGAIVKFHSEAAIQPKSLFSSLLAFANRVCSASIELRVCVSNSPTLGNALARSFFKTLAAEKYPKILYIYTERLLRLNLSFNELSSKIEGNWLITGGLSGIGLAIAKWLVHECSAENLVLISRRVPDKDLDAQLNELRKRTNVIVISASVADFKKLQEKFARIPFKINGVIHSAGVVRDGAMERQTSETFSEVFTPKGDGYHAIDTLLRDNGHHLDHFIVMSSFTVVTGNVGQLNYGVSNAYLDHQMYLRRMEGKPGTTIHWGNWLDTGMAKRVQKTLTNNGFLGLTNEEALKYLRYAIIHKPYELTVAKLDWETVLKKRPDIRQDIVIEAPDRTITGVGCYERFGEQLGYELIKSHSLEKDHDHIVLEQETTTEEGEPFLQVNDRGRVSDDYPASNMVTSGNTGVNSAICNVFGLNVFFDSKDDFRESTGLHIEALSSMPSSSPPLRSSKPYVLHAMGKSLAEVGVQLKGLFYEPRRRKCCGKSVMMFTGQGSQYPFMGKQLSTMFPVFREAYERCLRLADIRRRENVSLIETLDNPDKALLLQSTSVTQPIMFAFGYACAMLWQSFGFQPDYCLGHSVGELVAGVVAGIMTLEEGVLVVVERGAALEKVVNRGALLAIDSRAWKEIAKNFKVFLAAVNSCKQIVIAGTQEELLKVSGYMKSRNIRGMLVNPKYPFHNSLIEENDLKELKKLLETIKFKEARVPILSNVSGDVLSTFTPEYLIEQTVSPVQLVKCIHGLETLGVTIWLEAGPANTMTSFVRGTLDINVAKQHDILQTASDKGEDAQLVVAAALALERQGVPISWPSIYRCEVGDAPQRTPVLDYPLELKKALSNEDKEIVQGHYVNRENLVPGAYQVYQLLTWINAHLPLHEYFTLTGTKFVSPWKSDEGGEFKLIRTNANVLKVEVNGKATCVSHAKFNTGPVVPFLNVDEVRAKCIIDCDVQQFYRMMAINGLEYHDQFQVIKSLRRSDTCTYSLLQVKHPRAVWTLFDAAFHAVCFSVVHRRPDVYFVPIAVGEIWMSNSIDLPQAKSVVLVTEKVAENDKLIDAHACLLVDNKVIFQYKSKLSMVIKSSPTEVILPEDVDSVPPVSHAPGSHTIQPGGLSNNGNLPEKRDGVYIVGYDGSLCFDVSDNLQLWQAMKTGILKKDYKSRECAEKGPALMDVDVTEWDPEFFGVSPREAKYVDVLQRFMMRSVVRCMENAGWASMPKETGIFIGVSGSDFNNRVYSEVKGDISGYFGVGSSASCVAGRIAHWLQTEGPAIVVDTACSSSFVALTSALDAIIRGKCDHAIVGGVNIILHDTVTQVLRNAGVLSAKGVCRVFDAGADGYVRSEAVGCILLSRNSSGAEFRITHWAIGHNGKASSLQVPNGSSQERLMRALNSGNIEHVECHGTGTSLGDPIEIRAVSRCYGAATISSIKSLLGHAEAASGIVSLLACLQQMKHNYRAPQSWFTCPNPEAEFGKLVVSAIGEEISADLMAINNFGFSGTNCSIIVEKLPPRFIPDQIFAKYLMAPISSADRDSLRRMVDEFKSYVEQSDQLIGHICTKLQKGRPSYRYRHCILYDYKRQIVWETGAPLDDTELLGPLHVPDFTIFAYGHGFHHYQQNNRGNNFNGFLKQVIPKLNPIDIPKSPLTSLRFHQFIANSYVDGHFISWSVYNTEPLNSDTLLPPYHFNNKKYWPFEKQFACNFPASESSRKPMYYERTRLKVPQFHQRDRTLPVVNLGEHIDLPNCEHHTLSEFQLLISSRQKRIILYHTCSSSITEALELISLWQTLENQNNFVLVIACENNGTSYTEWTALCRTLASERLLPYKFVSYSTYEELESELSFEDIFECIFYEQSSRYAERLVQVTLKRAHIKQPQHLLITGGTGGIGKRIIEFMNPKRTTVVTRNLKNGPTRRDGENRIEFIESNLATLGLPTGEEYDVVVHCAGVVDNSLMALMNYSRFQKVCNPKSVGFATLLNILKGKDPKLVVAASSVAAILGSQGQANYAFANGLITSSAEMSESPTMVIHWGPWKNTGMLQGDHADNVFKQLHNNGWEALEPLEALDVLNSNAKDVLVFSGDFKVIAKQQEHLRKFLSEIVPLDVFTQLEESVRKQVILSPEREEKTIERQLEEIIARVSGSDRIAEERHTPLMNLGIDSLMIEEIRVAINERFDCAFKATEIYDNCTLSKLQSLVTTSAELQSERSTTAAELEPSPSTAQKSDIAIIGYSGAFSGCRNVEEFWENLLTGKECITRTESSEEGFVDAAGLIDDIDKFDHNFWKMTHDDASMLDPQLRVFVQNAYNSLESAGYVRQRNDLKVGVFAGAEPSEYGDPSEEAEGSLHRLFKLNMKDFVATFTAHMLNLRGPAIGVYSACSTALVAIAQACDSLRLTNIDLAIAGAVSLVLPGQSRYEFEEGLVLSKSGICKPFDSKADGTVRGSAVGCVVLKKLDKAIRDNDTIHAVIKSCGLSNDGLHKASFMAPNSSGQKDCISEALTSLSSTDVDRIRFVECHGTGTLVGDEIEIESMKSVYGQRENLTIGSVKANIGHGFAASGMASLFKVIKILQDQIVPPQINLDCLQEDNPFQINRKPMALESDSLAALSSFGIGGTNAHIVLESGKPSLVCSTVSKSNSAVHILPISGSSEKACIAQCRALANYLRSRSDIDLEAVASTLQQKRDVFKYRTAFVVKSVPEAISQLEAFSSPTTSVPLDNSNVCFFFAPQGVQYPNMEKASLGYAEVFKKELERLVGLASKLFQENFMEIMYPQINQDPDLILKAKYAQLALFIISRAIVAQLDSWGISSDFLIGHSVGEYAAACYAGIMDEFSCMKLLKERGELVSTTKEARMLAVVGFRGALPDDIEVTAHLSGNMKCVVGPPGSIEAVKEKLLEKGIAFRELSTEHGFHSSMMDCVQGDFIKAVKKIPIREGTKKIVSNIDGEIITKFDYNYCWNHMRRPVDLKKCLDTTLSNRKIKVVVEIGPSGVVKHLLAERSSNIHVISTVLGRRRSTERSSHSQLLQSLADLWSLGYEVNFEKIFGGGKFDPNMPFYQFDQVTCWRERILKGWTARYFKASWSLLSNIKAEQEHRHQKKTLIISDTKQNITIECSICEVHLTKPSEAFAFTAEELTEYSLIIYLPETDLANVNEPFFLSRKICQALAPSQNSRFLVISSSGDASHFTAVGPIKQYHLGGTRKNIFVRNSAGIPLGLLIDNVLSMDIEENEVLYATPGHILNMTYVEVCCPQKRVELGETVLVIGGSGAIGSAYVNVLKKIPQVRNIVVTSRSLKGKAMPGVSYVSMDLCDGASVASALDEIRSRYGTITSIIHAAGVPTVPSLSKTTKEMLSVLKPKVIGVLNILEYLSRNDLSLDNLVMASSLSSVITLQGTEDYSASNLFMDALAMKGHKNVKRMLAVQWPSWKGAGMASTYESEALKSIISKASISTRIGKRIIRETLGMSGVVAYSPVPPPQMARMVEEIQLKGSTRQVSTIREHLSLTDEVISVWGEILGTLVHEKSDFFDIGGNSLSALRVVWSLNNLLRTNIAVDLLFKHPILSDFVKMLPQEVPEVLPGTFDPKCPAELTYSQENMFLLRQLEKGNHYNIIFSIHFRNPSPQFSFEKMIYSIHSLIARQHSLRTSFQRDSQSSKPKQVVHSLTECYQLISSDWLVDDILAEEESFDFILEHIPLRIRGGRIGGGYVIVFNQHHILTDGWSVTVLAAELKNIYSSYSSKVIAGVKPLPYSMSEYAYAQRQTLNFTEELEEFKALHEGREATTLPRRRVPLLPPVFKQLVQLVPEGLISYVKATARANQTTEFVVVLLAFIISLRRFKSRSHDNSIVIGYPVSGRNDEVKDLIGYFLNNTVLGVDIPLEDGLQDVILKVKTATTVLRRFERIPFHELVAALGRHHTGGNHLFEIFFNYRHQLDFPTTDFPNVDVEIVQASMNKIFNLSITFDELPEGTRVMMEYNSSKYRSDLMQDLVRDMLGNLHHRDKIIPQPCLSRTDYPSTAISQCLNGSYGKEERIALRRRNSFISYQELDQQICTIARFIADSWIKSTGSCVRSDDVITVDLASNDAVVVILAILKIGSSYAPMDKTWPESRKAQIIANLECSMSISDPLLSNISTKKQRKRRFLLNRTSTSDMIYVIHTSGSLGTPKGVAVSHRNVSAFLRGATPQTFLRPGRVVSHSVNIAFDVSVFNIFGSLMNGCELCMHEDIRRIPDEVDELQCDIVFLTSAMLDALTDSELNRIRDLEKLFVGGDTVHDRNLAKILKFGLDVTQIYGPTEATVWSLTNRCKALPEEGSLIGLPMLNEGCWIAQGLKEGELVITGAKVARGYFNAVDHDRFGATNGVPYYRTGDIVRNEKEGFIYRGRLDSQMKVRGHRIEGEEVEKRLLEASPMISGTKVVVIDETLVAFIVHDEPLDLAAVLVKLQSALPSYMVPSRIIGVPQIPLNSSGKVDKDKLLEEYSRAKDDLMASTPIQMSVTKQKVASIFEKLLKVKNVRPTDNFFAIGGHSLLLFELKNQLLTEFDMNIEVHDLFTNLTVQEVARLITQRLKESPGKIDTSIIIKLRETPEPKFNIYLIHAVGGSIFPYYAFLQVFPRNVNIYAIEYQLHFEADTIKELAALYAKAIAAHTGDVRPFPMGHSLGGTVSKEIVAEMKLWGWEIPIVVMFDTWTVRELDMERVTAFAKKTFSALPDYEERVQKTTRLANMLRNYSSALSTTKIYLFKSAEVNDNEAFRRVVRPDQNESILRAMTENRLGPSSTQPIDVWLIDGNHESCMKPENLITRKKTILSIFDKWL